MKKQYTTILTLLLIAITTSLSSAIDFPAQIKPGKAKLIESSELSNNILSLNISLEKDSVLFKDKITGKTTSAQLGDFFEITLADGTILNPAAMQISYVFSTDSELFSDNRSSLQPHQIPQLSTLQFSLLSRDKSIEVTWNILLRDDSNYLRHELVIKPITKEITVTSITFNKFTVDQAQTIGTVKGSPIVSDTMFFAYEHPNASNLVIDPSKPQNLALNCPASASDIFQNLKPALAVDGTYDVNQHWGAQNTPVSLTVDLKKQQTIDTINLITYHNGSRYYGYKIETSKDGKKWQPLIDASNNKKNATPNGYKHKNLNTKTRFIKTTITNNSQGNVLGGHIVELEVFKKQQTKASAAVKLNCSLSRNSTLKPNQKLNQSAVIGVIPKNQLRRAFLYYIERERISPYHQFLHYNSWYDIAYPSRDKMNEQECLDVIDGWGKKLITKRNIPLDSFVFDDGWDDPKTLWLILKENFPDGWNPLKNSTEKYDTNLGVWLSPFGGYGHTKQARIDYGKTQGFETGPAGFSLAGENYFKRFRQSCMNFVNDYDVNFFKFDGTDAKLIEETEALFRLTGELYDTGKIEFISLTVGTWASPFWLMHGDSIWRGGGDMGFTGVGSKRQKWLTYRDTITYQNMVQAGPLYPLNSFMNQGIAHAKFGTAILKPNAQDFANEVHSFFGIGTNLQELYISHDLMTDEMWDTLAEGAKWSKANAHILIDTHWIGGDPAKLQVYGTAAWQDDRCTIMLRNPSDKPAKYFLDIAKTLELPQYSPSTYLLHYAFHPYKSKPPITLSSAAPHTFQLQPFEVIVLQGKAFEH